MAVDIRVNPAIRPHANEQTAGVTQTTTTSVGIRDSDATTDATVRDGSREPDAGRLGQAKDSARAASQAFPNQGGAANASLDDIVDRDFAPSRQATQQTVRRQSPLASAASASSARRVSPLAEAASFVSAASGQAPAATATPLTPIAGADVPQGLEPMSSRTPGAPPGTDPAEALADSYAAAELARMGSRGLMTPSTPSRMATEAVDEADFEGNVEAGERLVQRAQVGLLGDSAPKSQAVPEIDRPDSIFNRPFMYRGKSREARTRMPSLRRPTDVVKAAKDRAANAFKRLGVGNRVYGKMNPLPTLDLREVGIGGQEVLAAVRQDATMFNRLLATYTDEEPDVSTWSVKEISDFVNKHEIYVGTFKPPNNRGQDVQRRRLRILTSEQRGIYVHPLMAAMYTADFDGDDMEVSFDPKVSKLARDPMDHMVGIDGKQSLDTAFIPSVKFVDGWDNGKKTARDYVREVVFEQFANIDGRTIRPLVDAVLAVGDAVLKSDDALAAAWGRVFTEARKVADTMSTRRDGSVDRVRSDERMSRMCRAVFSSMQNVRIQNSLSTINADVVAMDGMPDPRTYDDTVIYKIAEGMVQGAIPNNFQELKVMLTGYRGNVKDKNAPFRFSADVGKMVKMDSRLQIGDEFVIDPNDNEQMREFFEATVKFAESRAMSTEIKKAGRSQYYTQLMRDKVIKSVHFPDSLNDDGTPMYGSYVEFLKAFVQAYNRHSAIINQSNLVWLSTMEIASDSNRGLVSPLNPTKGGVTIGDIAEPMLSIYGTYSVGRMFSALTKNGRMVADERHVDTLWSGNPNKRTFTNRPVEREFDYFGTAKFWITGKYINNTLRQFANENRLVRGEETMGDELRMDDVKDSSGNVVRKGLRNTAISSLSGQDDETTQFKMLLAIADKRTSTASEFAGDVYGMMGRGHSADEETTVRWIADLVKELRRLDTDGTVSGRRDQMLWVNDVINTLIASGPDMFSHFGMDSPAGFLQSPWARKMVEHANDIEVLGGIRTAMVFAWRMDRVEALVADIANPVTDGWARYRETYNIAELARDELAASSEVWRGIIKELMAEGSESDKSVFQMIREKALVKESPSGRVYRWDVKMDAKEFWANPGEHMTLRSVIEDLDMDRETKWNVITDVVRYWENDPYLKSYEVGYQLEVGNDATYSLGSGASKGALTVHRDFEKAFNRWGKTCQENMQAEVSKASGRHRKHRGRLMRTLQRLDASPWELVQIDDGMYADSILSVLDKEYAQTEKASQHPWTNAVYAALSFQRNGGYQNDITRTDDRLLGVQSVDSVGIQDIIHILADPNSSLEVYNEIGEKGILTRDALLREALDHDPSGDIESDIWEFLEQEPRIASAIRAHNACVSSSTDGDGYLGAALSLRETIDRFHFGGSSPVEHVKYLMRDHPVYAGIISLVNPAKGAVARSARARVAQTEAFLASELYNYASSGATASEAADAIMRDLGITQAALRNAMRSDYDTFLSGLKLPISTEDGGADNGEADADADKVHDDVRKFLTRYVDEIRISGVRLNANIGNPRSLVRVAPSRTIAGFRGKNSFLSNFYKTNVTIDGITYKNAEAAFQAQKCANPADRVRFSNLSGKDARDLGRKVNLREDWDLVKEDVMRDVISAKFSNPRMRRMLDATGDAELVEANTWGDTTWGVSGGRGENLLGKILMDERGTTPTNAASRPSHLGIDAASVASFYDVIQELAGAKTAVSTGVEGAETYQYAEWASHVRAKDRYADLKAVDPGDFDASWTGMWTNLTDKQGNPLTLRVGEGGMIENYAELLAAGERLGIDEIVTMVPEGYDVQDRSTDSHGDPVPSLFAYMVSKRSNGAEAFNLKAKKTGIDDRDSVTKMNGKYKMVTDDQGVSRRASLQENEDALNQVARQNGENGLNAAKLWLANMLLEENQDLGYKDLTLSNFMSMADLMVIEGRDEGGSPHLYLRTLEMLFSAIKHRLGPAVDALTDEEVFDAVEAIVNDNTETGVGIARMFSPMEALDGIRPMSKSSSFSGVRSRSSVFQRNYDLLSEIAKNSKYEPMSQARATQLSKRYVGEGRSDKSGGIRGIKDVFDRCDIVRNYDVVGYAGAQDGSERIDWTVGPSMAIVIGTGDVSSARVAEICEQAWGQGMTVIVSSDHINDIPNDMRADAMPCSDFGDVLIPCFDSRLNGSEAKPNVGRFAIFQAPFSRFVASVEDSINEFLLGDAEAKPLKALTDRIKVVENKSIMMTAEDLFPNVFRNPGFKNALTTVSLASGEEIASLIVDGVRCTIDYGVVEGGNGFDQRKRDVDAAIERYRSRWAEANADGIIMEDCQPGDIVGWAELEIRDPYGMNPPQYVLSPIIPFPLHGPTKNVMERFSVQQLGNIDDDCTIFAVDVTNTSGIAGGFAKYFDSSGGANKGMMRFSEILDEARTLMDGTQIDAYIAKASTDSRKIGTDRRIKTMISLMALARMHGYNFAESEGAFPMDPEHPENDDIRTRLRYKRIKTYEWAGWLKPNRNMLFTSDQRLNAFLNFECRKILANGGNPSDYLANTFTNDEGSTYNTHVMWEFEAMFEQGLNYEDGLLRFLHAMDPTFCPNGVDDMSDGYLFRLYRDASGSVAGYDTGVLQMQVPHRLSDGSIRYLWDNVYIGMSFFGEDYSGFSRPNIDGASNFLDAMNTMSYYGARLDEKSARYRAMWASADFGRVPHDGGAIGRA